MAARIEHDHTPDAGERELFELVRLRSFRRGRFMLSSGVESELYFNLKPTMMWPRGACLAAKAFLARIRDEGADYVGGLEMGAVPLLGGVAALSAVEDRPIPTFFVRKEAKTHGTRDVIEGLGPGESLAGKNVVVADDVATTGRALLKAALAAREAGATVACALVVVDREEGAAAALAAEGIRLRSVFQARLFL